jgi:hypothetical protein
MQQMMCTKNIVKDEEQLISGSSGQSDWMVIIEPATSFPRELGVSFNLGLAAIFAPQII